MVRPERVPVTSLVYVPLIIVPSPLQLTPFPFRRQANSLVSTVIVNRCGKSVELPLPPSVEREVGGAWFPPPLALPWMQELKASMHRATSSAVTYRTP